MLKLGTNNVGFSVKNSAYLPQTVDCSHDEHADKKAQQISNTTRKRLCQDQTEDVQENPADLRPVIEGSLQSQPIQIRSMTKIHNETTQCLKENSDAKLQFSINSNKSGPILLIFIQRIMIINNNNNNNDFIYIARIKYPQMRSRHSNK